MLPPEHPDRIQIAFDDHRLVANAGLILPVTLAHHLGLGELVDHHVDLGDAPGRANAGDKLLTLVASALAGGDCIDDADALRAGGTERALGCAVKAPSTLGTFLRSFRWGHVRQLDRVSREALARAWAADAGPGDGPLTIDLDSTICETYGLGKEGARDHNYAGQRGYNPILAVAAGTGEVLMCRLRKGRANTARGAAHFLVAYTRSGRPTATIVRDNKAILDDNLFQTECASVNEARYVLAFVNSNQLSTAAETFMPRGLYGARHLQKHGWKLPIPRYDANDPLHVRLSELGETAEQECQALIAESDIPTKPAGDA